MYGIASYAATKAAVRSFADILRLEVVPPLSPLWLLKALTSSGSHARSEILSQHVTWRDYVGLCTVIS